MQAQMLCDYSGVNRLSPHYNNCHVKLLNIINVIVSALHFKLAGQKYVRDLNAAVTEQDIDIMLCLRGRNMAGDCAVL